VSVIVTSDYTGLSSGAIKGRLGRTSATTGQRGRARMSISIVSEPLVHNFDDLALGKAPAEALAGIYRDKVEGISESASPRTLETRKYQEAAYARGEPWASSRFSGGRTGPTPPRSGEQRMFNHSGRFAKGLVATENRTEKGWTINVPANRLDPRTSRNAREFAFITDALRRLLPELDDPRRIGDDPRFRAALEATVRDLIANARTMNATLRASVTKARLDALRALTGGVVDVVFG
jgi:hypothetical protein